MWWSHLVQNAEAFTILLATFESTTAGLIYILSSDFKLVKTIRCHTHLRRRGIFVLKLELEPVGEIPEVSDVVLEDEDNLLGGGDALVPLAGPVKVVHCPADIFKQKCPIPVKYIWHQSGT